MREAGITDLLVVDDGQLVGIVRERDIFHSLAAGGSDPLPNPKLLSVVRVAGVMSYAPATVDDTTPLSEALRLMAHSGASTLPVLHRGRLVGVFTVSNALRAALEMLWPRRNERDEDTSS